MPRRWHRVLRTFAHRVREGDHLELAGISLRFDSLSHSHLRRLIDALNRCRALPRRRTASPSRPASGHGSERGLREKKKKKKKNRAVPGPKPGGRLPGAN